MLTSKTDIKFKISRNNEHQEWRSILEKKKEDAENEKEKKEEEEEEEEEEVKEDEEEEEKEEEEEEEQHQILSLVLDTMAKAIASVAAAGIVQSAQHPGLPQEARME